MQPLTAQLDYAPADAVRRRKLTRRRVFAAVSITLIIITARYGATTISRTQLLYNQRHCLRHSAPPDQVVFDTFPDHVAALSSDPNFVVAGGCAFRRPPAAWEYVKPATAGWGNAPRTVIFLHELRCGSLTRLVQLERVAGSNSSPYFITGYDVQTHSIKTATFGQPILVEQQFPTALSVMDSIGPHQDIRIFAGQIDPADVSHFTIQFESRGKMHIANGYLRSNGHIEINRGD